MRIKTAAALTAIMMMPMFMASAQARSVPTSAQPVNATASAPTAAGCFMSGKVSKREFKKEILPGRSQGAIEADIKASGCIVSQGKTKDGYDYRKIQYRPGTGTWGSQIKEVRVKYIYSPVQWTWYATSKNAIKW